MDLTEIFEADGSFSKLSPEQSADEQETYIGTTFQNYRVTEVLGIGGMASVFKAVRCDGAFERTVAIKFMCSDVLSEIFLERFKFERKIHANLNHPNIVKMYDSGITETGVPFIIMDYIDGLELDEFVAGRSLVTTQRINLFRKIVSAVRYAHENGIVHRDLKPSNIIVDKELQPVLLDFGIANQIDDSSEKSFSSSPHTVRFASPEQLFNQYVGPASDIFQLGNILIFILTGSHLYQALERSEVKNAANNPKEHFKGLSLIKLIEEDDLKEIILNCIGLDISERYESASSLIYDIDNFLSCRPINSRRSEAFYVLNKWRARHKFGSSILMLFLVSILAYFFTINSALEKARISASESKAKTRILTNMISSTDLLENSKNELSFSDFLKENSMKLAKDKSIPLKVKSEILGHLALVMLDNDMYESAHEIIEKSIDSVDKPKSYEEALLLVKLGYSYHRAKKDDQKASDIAAKGYLFLEEHGFKGDEGSKRKVLHYMALIHKSYNPNLSKQFFKTLHEMYKALPGYESNKEYINLLGNYASASIYNWDSEDSEILINELLDLTEKVYGRKHTRISIPLIMSAKIDFNKGNIGACLRKGEEAYQLTLNHNLKSLQYFALEILSKCELKNNRTDVTADYLVKRVNLSIVLYGEIRDNSDVRCLSHIVGTVKEEGLRKTIRNLLDKHLQYEEASGECWGSKN